MAEVIPLFPLGTVLFPGLVLPIHVFEERYRTLVADLAELPKEQRRFGVVAIRDGWEVGEQGVRALHDIGTDALVRSVRPAEDGTSDLMTVGQRRFRLLSVDDESKPYLQGTVEWLDEESVDEVATALAPEVADMFVSFVCDLARTRETASTGGAQGRPAAMAESADQDLDEVPMPEDARTLSYMVAATVPLDPADRQRLLEEPSVGGRLLAERRLILRERALLAALGSVPAPLSSYAARPSSS